MSCFKYRSVKNEQQVNNVNKKYVTLSLLLFKILGNHETFNECYFP